MTRSFSEWLRDQLSRASKKRSRPARPAARRMRLEALEDRLAPAADHLAVNAPFSPQLTNGVFSVEVDALDSTNNVDSTYNGAITISLGNNSSGATLGGTLTEPAFNGVAFFNDLSVNHVGSGYTLQATGKPADPGTSSAFDVIDQLVITNPPPSTVTAGQPFSLSATAEDANNNPDTSYTGSITLTDTSGAQVNGASSVTVPMSAGVVQFPSLTLTRAETTNLQLTGNLLQAVSTNNITVQAGPASKFTVTQEPFGSVLTNSPFDFEVDASDAYGNLATGFNGSVNLSLANNPSLATLGGTTSVTASGGIATFHNLSVNKTGSGYTIQATSNSLSVTSDPFDVQDQLVVTTQPPASVTAGVPFTVGVSAEDGLGHVDTTFTGAVTVANSNFFGSTLGGTTTLNASAGVATFSNLTLTQTANSLSLDVSSPGQQGTTTSQFNVVAAPATQLQMVGVLNTEVVTGAPFSFSVAAEDQFGNIDKNFTGNVNLTLSGNPAATLGGTTTLAATAGEADFTNLSVSKPGSNYTLTASATGLTAATSAPFDVRDKLVFTTQPPTSVTAGVPFGFTVKAEDNAGNVDTGFNGSLSVFAPGATLAGARTVTASSGVATFSGLMLDSAGTPSLAVSGDGVTSATSNPVTVTAAAATHLVVSAPTGNVLCGAPFNLTVQAQDPFGNVDTNFSGSVSLVLASNPGRATLGGTTTVTASHGVASFTGLTINAIGTSYTLKATSGNLTAGVSPQFDVTNQLVITTQPPASVLSGATFGLTVKVEDGVGGLISSYNGPVTIAATDSLGNNVPINGTLRVNASGGIATFTGLSLTQAGSATLTVSATGLPSATANITVNPAAATHLVFTTVGDQAPNGTFTVTVNALDANGNVDTNYSGNVTLSLGNNPAGATLGGTLVAQASNGVATFSGLTIDKVGSGYTLQASATGLSSGTSAAFNVQEKLVVVSPAFISVKAGDTIPTITIKVEDGQGNVDGFFNGTVTVSASDYPGHNVPLGGTLTAQVLLGTATFSDLSLTQAGFPTLTFTASGLTSASTFAQVTAAAASQLTVSAPTGTLVPGAPFNVLVSAQDRFGNQTNDFSGTITLALGNNSTGATLGGTLVRTATGSSTLFSGLTINEAGSGYTLQASSPGLTAGTSTPFNVQDQLVITTQPPSSLTANSPFGLVVKAENGQGVVDTSYHGLVTIFIPDDFSHTLKGTLSTLAQAGVATFSGLTIGTAGSEDISVSGSGAVDASTNSFTVTPTAATHLVFAGPIGTVSTGTPFSVEVDAADAQGNTDPNFNGTITLTLGSNPTGATLGGTLTAQATAGRALFSGLTINEPGSGYNLLATGGGLGAGTSDAFNVQDQLVITTQPPADVTAGSDFGLTVAIEDGQGNVDTSYNGPVTVSGLFGIQVSGNFTVQAVNGVATFTHLVVNQATSDPNFDLTVSASGVGAATTRSIEVDAAAATHLVVTAPTGPVQAGTAFSLQVQAEDANGNVDPAFNGNVTISLPGATLSGILTVQAHNGIASFSGLSITPAGTGYSIQASASGLTSGASSPFDVVQDQLVVTASPSGNVTAGTAFSVTVEALDPSGHVDTNFHGDITASTSSFNFFPVTLGGTTKVTASNGVATFSNLIITQANAFFGQGWTVNFNASGVGGTSTTVNVTPGAATKLSVTAFPGFTNTVLTGATFGGDVQATDAYGNVDTNYNGTVTLSLGNNPTGATLGGILTVQLHSGFGTASNLTINEPGSGYTLQASAAGLNSGTSAPFNVEDQLIVTTGPSGVTAGSGFTVVVKAVDALGNVDTNFNGSITLTSLLGMLSGLTTVQASGGVATFTNLILKDAGDASITVDSGTAAGNSILEDVSAAAATHLVVLPPNGNVFPGAAFGVQVFAEDNFGNVDPNFTGNVTIGLGVNTSGATLGGTLAAAASSGVATFSGLTINEVGTGYTIHATSSPLTAGDSAPFDVLDQLVVTTPPPSTVVAGAVFGLTVKAEDASGNVLSSFNGPVTVSGGSLGGTMTVTAQNGIATFSNLMLTQAGLHSLTVGATGYTTATAGPVSVSAAAANQIVFVGPTAANGSNFVTSPFNVSVQAEDTFGNVDPTYTTGVTVALHDNPTGATLGGTLTVNAVSGIATFNGLTLNEAGSGYSLQANSDGLPQVVSALFNVENQLVVTTPPSTISAGGHFGLVVKALDGLGNVDTSFNGNVTVSLMDSQGASISGQVVVAAQNGVATFSNLSMTQAGFYMLSLSASGLAATETPLSVNAGAATQLVVKTSPTIVSVGAPFNVALAAEDNFGNIDPNYSGSATIALGNHPAGANLSGTLSVFAGQGTVFFGPLSIDHAGTGYTLQITSSLPTVTTASFTVAVPGVATQLVVTTQPPATLQAGAPFGLTVSAEDSFGAVDSSYNGNVTVVLAGQGNLTGTTTVAASNGVATFSGLKLTTAGQFILALSSGSLTGTTSNAIDVSAGTATHLMVPAPSGVLPGTPFTLEVDAEDDLGNVDSSFNGSVTIALGNNPSNATLGGTLTMTASNGVAMFTNLTIDKLGLGYTLKATTNGLPAATSAAFDVTKDHLVVATGPSGVSVGTAFGLVINAVDKTGNVDSTFNDNVTLTLANGPAGSALGGTVTVQAHNGVASFSNVTVNEAGSYVLTASDSTASGVGSVNTDSFNASDVATKLVVTTQPPASVTAGNTFTVVVTAEDPLGNPVPTYNGLVTIALGNNPTGATLGGTLTLNVSGGVASFGDLTISKPGSGYTLTASAAGLSGATTNAFNATSFHVEVTAQPPVSVAAGTPFSLTATVKDSNGVVDTAYNGNVTVSLVNLGGSGGNLGGTLTVAAHNGVASFTGLTVDQAGSYQLSISAAGIGTATSSNFAVTPAQGISNLTLTGGTVLEFRPIGSFVGSFSSTESGSGHSFTYTLVPGTGATDNGAFTIQGNTLQTNDSFDFSAKSNYSIRVRTTDEAGHSLEQVFNVTILNDNSLTRSGNTLTITGTAATDTLAFTPGATQDTLNFNGNPLAVDTSTVSKVVYQGKGGILTLNGGSGKDSLTVGPTGGSLSGTGYSFSYTGVGNVTVNGGAGDLAMLTGTKGNDTFTSTPTLATLKGSGLLFQVKGFSAVTVKGGGGTDSASMTGNKGSNSFLGKTTASVLSGLGYSDTVQGFRSVTATLPSGGTGRATLNDSSGNDVFTGTKGSSTLKGSTYSYTVKNFPTVSVVGTKGFDKAVLTAPKGTNKFTGSRTGGTLSGTGYSIILTNVDDVTLNGSKGSKDTYHIANLLYTLHLSPSGVWVKV